MFRVSWTISFAADDCSNIRLNADALNRLRNFVTTLQTFSSFGLSMQSNLAITVTVNSNHEVLTGITFHLLSL